MTKRRKKNKLSKGYITSKKDVLEYQKSMRKWSSQKTFGTISPGMALLLGSGIVFFWAKYSGSYQLFNILMVVGGILFLLALMSFVKDK